MSHAACAPHLESTVDRGVISKRRLHLGSHSLEDLLLREPCQHQLLDPPSAVAGNGTPPRVLGKPGVWAMACVLLLCG